jgi:hypothetical protein
MKRKNRQASKKRQHHHKEGRKVSQKAKRSRKELKTKHSKQVLLRKRNQPIDPRVARALGLMRRERVSASQAARREGMKLKTFQKSAGRYLYRSSPGKPWKARSHDQLRFLVNIPTTLGIKAVVARNYRERKLAGAYDATLRMWRAGEDGAEAALKAFEGKTVGGQKLITDTKLLSQLEEAGQLDFDTLYASFGAGS